MYKYLPLLICVLFYKTGNGQDIHDLAMKSFQRTVQNYPELKNAKIKIEVRTKGSAMAASYTWWSIFRRPEKRKYFVKVNKNIRGAYLCFQFDHLKESSRDGVLGHELAHIDCFHSLNFFGFLKFIINQALPGGITKSERATDYRTIKHGLGRELRSWSNETRTKFGLMSTEAMPKRFDGRYLTPTEIDSVMLLFPALY